MSDASTILPSQPAGPSQPHRSEIPPAWRHVRIRPESGWKLIDLREMWQCRELLFTFAARDLKVRYKQTAFGVIWVILQPLATAMIFAFVFGRVLRIPPPGEIPTILFIFAALTGFYLFRDIFARSTTSMVGNANLVRKCYFPRPLLPASTVLSSLVDFAVALTVFGLIWGLLAIAGASVPGPGWHMLLWPVCVLLLVMMAAGMGMAATAMAVSWRDVGHVIPVLLMLVLYASPVMYDVDYLFAEGIHPVQRAIYFANPFAGLVAVYRWSLIGVGSVSWFAFAWSVTFAFAAVVIGAFVFRRMERRFADVI